MEKANITLYTVIGDPGRIVTAIQDRYKEMTKEITSENGNIILTLLDDSSITFNISHQQDKPDSLPPTQPVWPIIFLQQRHLWLN